jgi:acetyl esterase
MCRDRGGPAPKGQGLIGPVLDFARWYDLKDDSGFAEEMQYYARAYCPDARAAASPYVSQLINAEFRGLPPAYIMSTELDELRQDAVSYAAALRQAGIQVQLVIEPGLVHAPVRGRSVIPQVADAWRRFCGAVAELAAS